MHKYPYIIVGVILLASIYLVLFSNNSPDPDQNKKKASPSAVSTTPKQENYTASFLIFTNGTKRIFTAPMYHNLSPDVFIQNPNPSVIVVRKSEVTWKDFFSTLPMGLSPTCLTTGTGQSFCDGKNGNLQFFLNGKETPEILDTVIMPNDKLLVTFGNSTETQIKQQFDQIPDTTASQSGEVSKE